ncbi:MAG: cupin domain-containing protein [Vicinamibacterales bacterium]
MTLLEKRTALAIGLALAGWVATVQTQDGKKPPTPVTTNFTGRVSSLDASDIRSVRFQYAAGARSYWHTHGGDQILVLEQGKGRLQIKGQPMREFGPKEPVMLPGGVPHWHGAAPDQGLVQIAVNIGPATFDGPVSDDEYLGRAR